MDPVDARIVALALEGHSTAEIGREVGLHRATVWRRMQRSDVAAALAEAQQAAVAAAERNLRQGAEKAAKTMLAALDEPDASLRLRAAAEVLDRVGVGRAEDSIDAVEHPDGSLTLRGRRYREEEPCG